MNLSSLFISCLIGLPIGAFLSIYNFPFKISIIGILSTMMSFPPVVIGLIVYIHVSRSGPLGWLNILYTPSAMIVAQIILIVPIISSLSYQFLENLNEEYNDLFFSLSVPKHKAMWAYLFDARYSLCTVVLAGLGRAMSEVGAVIIVGGNIDHLTRIMTTAIALETSKGNLSLALALGVILLFFSLIINISATYIKNISQKNAY